MIFHIFPYLFYHRFLVSNCSKFCVKRMGSTVYVAQPREPRVLEAVMAVQVAALNGHNMHLL